MGMYDTIRCKYPLPDKEVQNEDFQTKDLDCELTTYEIREDGQLVDLTGDNPGEVHYPVTITFYTSLDKSYKDPSQWYEYEAEFVDGKLKTIKKIRPTTP